MAAGGYIGTSARALRAQRGVVDGLPMEWCVAVWLTFTFGVPVFTILAVLGGEVVMLVFDFSPVSICFPDTNLVEPCKKQNMLACQNSTAEGQESSITSSGNGDILEKGLLPRPPEPPELKAL